MYALTWLKPTLEKAGLVVKEVDGWRTRGHGDVGAIKGVLLHHTAGPQYGEIPSMQTLINGRPDLSGPVCNLGLGRSGAFYLVAAGRAYHAGEGEWQGITKGNSQFVGIEAENTGADNDPWPQVQYDAYVKGVAAILSFIGASSIMAAGHKEYALPKGRKDDPNFPMDEFRMAIDRLKNEAP